MPPKIPYLPKTLATLFAFIAFLSSMGSFNSLWYRYLTEGLPILLYWSIFKTLILKMASLSFVLRIPVSSMLVLEHNWFWHSFSLWFHSPLKKIKVKINNKLLLLNIIKNYSHPSPLSYKDEHIFMLRSWNNTRHKHQQQLLYFNIKVLQPEKLLLCDWLEVFVFRINLQISYLRKYCTYNNSKKRAWITNAFDM